MSRKGVVSEGYNYKNGGKQKTRQFDAYKFNQGVKLEDVFNFLTDIDYSAEYIEHDGTGTTLGYSLKEQYFDENTRAGISINAGNKLTYFDPSFRGGAGGGGTGGTTDLAYGGQTPTGLIISNSNGQGVTIPKLVQAYNTISAFPASGAIGVLYVDKATDKTYLWDDTTSAFIQVGGPSTTPVVTVNTVYTNTFPLVANVPYVFTHGLGVKYPQIANFYNDTTGILLNGEINFQIKSTGVNTIELTSNISILAVYGEARKIN
jgi:hypothetical protein